MADWVTPKYVVLDHPDGFVVYDDGTPSGSKIWNGHVGQVTSMSEKWYGIEWDYGQYPDGDTLKDAQGRRIQMQMPQDTVSNR